MTITLDALVPEPAERDELIQLLNWIATEWHQNEQAFENRQLADWPQWCEDQGFRFEVLQAFGLKLEATLQTSATSTTISQHIASLGATTTVSQLLDMISEHSPQLVKAFQEVLEISQDNAHALDAVAGGTAYIKTHPYVDGVAVIGTGLLVGVGAYLKYKGRQVQERTERGLAREKQNVERQVEREVPLREVHDIVIQEFDEEAEMQGHVWRQFQIRNKEAQLVRQAKEEMAYTENLQSTLVKYQEKVNEALIDDFHIWISDSPYSIGGSTVERLRLNVQELIVSTQARMNTRFAQEENKLTDLIDQEVRQDARDEVLAAARSFAEREERDLYHAAMGRLFEDARAGLRSMLDKAVSNDVLVDRIAKND